MSSTLRCVAAQVAVRMPDGCLNLPARFSRRLTFFVLQTITCSSTGLTGFVAPLGRLRVCT